ncbi:MAG: hypothetical protein ACXVAY_06055 [Mucilaginibacter sp.]
MKILKYFALFIIPICIAIGCKKDQFGDLSLVTTAASASNVSVMFNITHDNTGIVTITPNGAGVVKYSVYFGDATTNPVTVAAGQNVTHTYAEGNYQVKIVGYDLKGGSATITQPLVVSFIAPQNLAVNLNAVNLSVNVSATAKYATFFKIYFGDSTNVTPVPFTNALASQVITHNYAKAGTYVVKVVALSGGAATTQLLDTVTLTGKQINLPVTFDDPTVNYTVSDFGGNVSTLVADPTNSSNHVMRSVKTAGALFYAGTTIGTGLGFSSAVPLTAANKKMTVMVYSPAAGIDVKLKLDSHTNPNNGLSVETDVLTTKVNQWETLTFDFSKQASGTPALNLSNKYDLASIFFDFGNTGTGATYYFDNLQMAPATLQQLNLPVTFDDPTVDYTMSDFGGNTSTLVVDPTNSSNHVLKSIKGVGAATYAGTTMGTGAGFASVIPLSAGRLKMTVMVYSPAAGLDVKLKLDNHLTPNVGLSVETDVLTTKVNQWETLTFDFSKPASGTPAWNPANTYDLASIFFDFGNAGTGSVFYWDNVILL